MSSARVDDDILAAGSDDNGDDREHIDPNVIINPGSGASEPGPSSGQQTESASERPRSVSRNRQPSAPKQSAEPPIPPSNRNSGQDHGDAGGEPHRSRDQGEGGRPEQRSNMPAGDGMRDNGGQGSTPADKEAETRERAIMTALLLIEEALDISQISSSVRLAGQSKLDVKQLLDNIKGCMVDITMLKIPDDDDILPRLRTARKTLQTMLMQSDEFEATATTPAGETGTGAALTSPSQPSSSPEPARELGSGLRYTLAMKQLDCEIVRLKSPRLINVEQGADVKPDILKDLLKVDVPDIRMSVDRARDALKTLTLVAGPADVEKILEAQDACEKAIDWIALVENRCKAEQLHLDVKQQAREVDFVPFRPGTGVSIYEFFQKFETWSRGMMSLDQKANILYNRHLDSSITDGNKELEDAKEDYQTMKALLIERWGVPDIVCDQYLANVNRLTVPTDLKDKAGLLAYTKNAYSSLITLTKLEVDRGQKVPGLEDYYLSNQYLKKLYKTLPEELASKFMFQLQENGESYHLMKGRVYMDRIISLLRCSYKGLEIALEETPNLTALLKAKPAKQVSVNAVMPPSGYTSSSSSDGQGGQTIQARQKKKMKTKLPPSGSQTLPSSLGTGSGSLVNTSQLTSPPTSQAQPTQTQPSSPTQPASAVANPACPSYQFAPNALSKPMTYANSPHQQLYQPNTAFQLGQSVAAHPTPQFCRGPRWACPVEGHTGHDLADCQEFWGAKNGAARRKMIFRSGCPSCLGKNQGCQDGRCDIIYQLPPDVVCEDCVKSCLPGKSPSNKMTCDITWHKRLPANIVSNAMEAWVPKLNIDQLLPNAIMSVNMFGPDIWVPHSISQPADIRLQQAESGCGYVQTNLERRISKLKADAIVMVESHASDLEIMRQNIETERTTTSKEFAKLREQIRDQENRISNLTSNFTSRRTADAASQTDPVPMKECEISDAATVVKKDVSCGPESDTSEVGDVTKESQTVVPRHTKPKKKRKPRKNRSRGARARAKAVAISALSYAEVAVFAQTTKDSPDPVAQADAIPALWNVEADILARVEENAPTPNTEFNRTPDLCPSLEANTEDRRYLILPTKTHSLGYIKQPGGVKMNNLFQGFCPPLADPCRLSRWFQIANLDEHMRHV